MPLDFELKEEIGLKVQSEIFRKIIRMDHELELRNLLRLLELEDLFPEEVTAFIPGRDIYVIGEYNVREDIILQIFKSKKINPNRVKLVKGYKELVNYGFEKLRDDFSIAAIFVGPIPHSVKDIGSYNSIINKMEQEPGYPPVIRLASNNNLKITKSNLKDAIFNEIKNKRLDTDN